MYTYMLVLLLVVNPYMFGVHHFADQLPLMLIVFFSTFFIPGFAMLLLKKLGFIQSLAMDDRHDRIIPYILTAVFYLSTYYTLSQTPDIPDAFKTFMLGGIIALFMAFFINNFSKISIHAVGMGGLLAMTVILIYFFRQKSFPLETFVFGSIRVQMYSILMIVLLLAGLVGSSRLLLSSHEPKDLWGGYLVGIAGQFIALQVLF